MMEQGRRLEPPEPLVDARDRCRQDLGRLPEALRSLDGEAGFEPSLSARLSALADAVARRLPAGRR
jgi:hypothetical protein